MINESKKKVQFAAVREFVLWVDEKMHDKTIELTFQRLILLKFVLFTNLNWDNFLTVAQRLTELTLTIM